MLPSSSAESGSRRRLGLEVLQLKLTRECQLGVRQEACEELRTQNIALQPPSCRPMDHSISSAQLRILGMQQLERYASTLQCGGETWLFTRDEMQDARRQAKRLKRRCWRTLARVLLANGSFTRPRTLLECDMNMSHNAAFTCLGSDTLVAFGSALGFGGVLRASLNLRRWHHGVSDAAWSPPQPVISSDFRQSGCVESRAGFGGMCEFDGKLSVVQHGDRLLLFARANVDAPGGRHVMLSSTRDLRGESSWSRFDLLRFDGYKVTPTNNIYYLAVKPLPPRPSEAPLKAVAPDPPLLGLFPGVVDGRAGVYYSTSTDGINWRAPIRLLASRHADSQPSREMSAGELREYGGRTVEVPVDGWQTEDGVRGTLSMMILHDVRYGGAVQTAEPYVCRYELPHHVFAPHALAAPSHATEDACLPSSRALPEGGGSDVAVTTWTGAHLNGAIAAVSDGRLISVLGSKTQVLGSIKCDAHALTVQQLACAETSSIAVPWRHTIPSALPSRQCQAHPNFRAIGPEDGRILPLPLRHRGGRGHAWRALLLYADFAWALENSSSSGDGCHGRVDCEEPPPNPYRRTMYLQRIWANVAPDAGSGSAAGEPRPQRVNSASPLLIRAREPAVARLDGIEKNWVPFTLGEGETESYYIMQWLCDAKGRSVTLRLDAGTGMLTRRYEASSEWLRSALGVASDTRLSGGTPAVRWNETHFLAIGHSVDEERQEARPFIRRHYALFAFVFEAAPPFRLTGTTPTFVLTPAPPPNASHPRPMARGMHMPPPPPGSGARLALGRIQFPVGLVVDGANLVVSWGHMDRQTMISRLDARTLLRSMRTAGTQESVAEGTAAASSAIKAEGHTHTRRAVQMRHTPPADLPRLPQLSAPTKLPRHQPLPIAISSPRLQLLSPFAVNNTAAFVFADRLVHEWRAREAAVRRSGVDLAAAVAAGLSFNSLGIAFAQGWDLASPRHTHDAMALLLSSSRPSQARTMRAVVHTDLMALRTTSDGDGVKLRATADGDSATLTSLRRDGFVRIPAIAPPVAEALRRRVAAHLDAPAQRVSCRQYVGEDATAGKREKVQRCGDSHAFAGAAPSVAELKPMLDSLFPPLNALATAYLGADAIYSGYMLHRIRPGHIAPSEYASGLWHHDRCGSRLKCFVYLQATIEGGHPLRVARGSHTSVWYSYDELSESRYADAYVRRGYEVVTLSTSFGEGICFDTNALHQGSLEGQTAQRDAVLFEWNLRNKSGVLYSRACGDIKPDLKRREMA